MQEGTENLFITGAAGTGKSFLVREFLKGRDRKKFPVVASTGSAAVLVGGRTFHSFFGLGIMEGGLDRTVDRALANRRVVNRLKKTEGFVLDEVSMISGVTLRAAETIARLAREDQRPWGGMRIIAVGDFAQLPPVSQDTQRDWAFLDEVWQRSDFKPVLLKTMLRSEDKDYLECLARIRQGTIDEQVHHYLSARVQEDLGELSLTRLFARRDRAEKFNRQQLASLETQLHEFPTRYQGTPQGIDQLKRNAPIPETLQLKEGALVMIRVNDPSYQFVNGSLGTIDEITPERLEITLKNRKIVELEPTGFSLLDGNGETIASATNFPVTLAYAITIHKAQGVTLDGFIADLRGLWEPGQAYVALSRLRNGSQLFLHGWDEASIRVDPQVAAFYQNIEMR